MDERNRRRLPPGLLRRKLDIAAALVARHPAGLRWLRPRPEDLEKLLRRRDSGEHDSPPF